MTTTGWGWSGWLGRPGARQEPSLEQREIQHPHHGLALAQGTERPVRDPSLASHHQSLGGCWGRVVETASRLSGPPNLFIAPVYVDVGGGLLGQRGWAQGRAGVLRLWAHGGPLWRPGRASHFLSNCQRHLSHTCNQTSMFPAISTGTNCLPSGPGARRGQGPPGSRKWLLPAPWLPSATCSAVVHHLPVLHSTRGQGESRPLSPPKSAPSFPRRKVISSFWGGQSLCRDPPSLFLPSSWGGGPEAASWGGDGGALRSCRAGKQSGGRGNPLKVCSQPGKLQVIGRILMKMHPGKLCVIAPTPLRWKPWRDR